MNFPKRVRLVEVGPRDGLQNEARPVPVEAKVALIDALSAAGHTAVEAGSFVSPKWVPQMANTDEVMARIERRPGVSYPVLVPNKQGMNGAVEARCEEIACSPPPRKPSAARTPTARSTRASSASRQSWKQRKSTA